MIKSYYIVHDCETGGLDYNNNPITEYAAIVLDPYNLKEVDRIHIFVQPYGEKIIEKKALNKTMVTLADINSGMEVKAFGQLLISFYKKYQAKGKFKDANRLISVGHNIVFDHGFLEHLSEYVPKYNFYDYFHESSIDTLVLGKMVWGLTGDEKIRLIDCCERAKIDLTDAHGAMNDVEANADLFRFLLRRLRATKSDGIQTKKETKRDKTFFEFNCR